jgi:hypothetical protein
MLKSARGLRPRDRKLVRQIDVFLRREPLLDMPKAVYPRHLMRVS